MLPLISPECLRAGSEGAGDSWWPAVKKCYPECRRRWFRQTSWWAFRRWNRRKLFPKWWGTGCGTNTAGSIHLWPSSATIDSIWTQSIITEPLFNLKIFPKFYSRSCKSIFFFLFCFVCHERENFHIFIILYVCRMPILGAIFSTWMRPSTSFSTSVK